MYSRAKKSPADHSKDYWDRQEEKAEKLGIEKMTINMASGVKVGMREAMKCNSITSAQEAWQSLGRYLKCASPEEQDWMLKPDSSDFFISENWRVSLRVNPVKSFCGILGMKSSAPYRNGAGQRIRTSRAIG